MAHKTGTGQQLGDMQTGYNDIGILTAPDGTRYAVAVMLAHTTAPNIDRMQFMQAISRTVATYHGRSAPAGLAPSHARHLGSAGTLNAM